MIAPYRWKVTDRRQGREAEGREKTLPEAKAAVEACSIRPGSVGVIAGVITPRGKRWSYRPHERWSGRMVWEKA